MCYVEVNACYVEVNAYYVEVNVCVADSGQVVMTRRMAVEGEEEEEEELHASLCHRQQETCPVAPSRPSAQGLSKVSR